MSRLFAAMAALSLPALAMGCPVDAVRLTVRVQSGFRAEHEIARVEISMTPGASCADAAASSRVERRDLVVADQRALGNGTYTASVFEGLQAGLYAVHVAALRPEGRGLAELLTRCHLVRVENDRVLRVPLTTDCVAVSCPGGGSATFTECLAGRCVDPRCDIDDPGTSEFCCDRALLGDACGPETTLCRAASDCATPLACSGPRLCEDGLCIEPDHGSCPDDMFCSARSGSCEPTLADGDAGVPDAAEDLDAGAEDAAPDADEQDAGAPDAAAQIDAAISIDATAGQDAVIAPDSCAGACTPGATSSASCGMCGTSSRTCLPDCTWGSYGACGLEGVCTSGARSSRACGCSGTQSRTCRTDCTWGSYGTCTGTAASCTDSRGATVCEGSQGWRDCGMPGFMRRCTCSGGFWTSCGTCLG